MDSIEIVLAHHGIKGMRWGVRRNNTRRGSKASKPPAHADAIEARTHKSTVKRGSTDALSNTELQSLVKRMNLEQQYHNLSGSQATTVKKGLSKVKSLISTAKTLQEVHSVINSPLIKDLTKSLKK